MAQQGRLQISVMQQMRTAVLVQLEGHGQHPDQEGYTPMPDRFRAPQADPCTTVPLASNDLGVATGVAL
jgi:hypothetical protein